MIISFTFQVKNVYLQKFKWKTKFLRRYRESVLTVIQCRYDQYIIIFRIQSFLMAINKPETSISTTQFLSIFHS